MNSFHYYNPVRIEFGNGNLKKLDALVGSRKVLFVTTPGFIKRGILNQVRSIESQIVHVVDSIPANPTFKSLEPIYRTVWKKPFEVIVVLGGGSVLDGAKVLSVYGNDKDWSFVDNIIRNKTDKNNYKLIPIISIPTTAGTGSEVTPWATVWDMDEKKKYSLHLPDLWSETCLCDPELTLTLPRDITIQTGLDALSQALESIWNKNANPISTQYAVTSAQEILRTLPKLAVDLSSIDHRSKMMMAALHSGLAFSNTQTAVAHAISYYITAHKGTPHGIACSFTLPDIVDTAIGKFPHVDHAFMKIFGELNSNYLREVFSTLNVSTHYSDYRLDTADMEKIRSSLVGNPRASNSLVDVESLFLRLSRKS